MSRKVGVNLWEFETKDNRSLRQAYRFLEPYAFAEKDWPYKQFTRGGARETIRTELNPRSRRLRQRPGSDDRRFFTGHIHRRRN
ncbi:hypothetical protein SH528x_002015 [Novipirellula sp. SH528]|uniref:hypothetical protein n=1 Tax=Novipirellula sp. SH528 TaxID=3454466 RepID=UPI003F9FDC1F